MIQEPTVLTTLNLPKLTPFKQGKVRHVYDLGDTLLMVATDRVSAFDYILPNGIPEKGRVLTQITDFWCHFLSSLLPTHLISVNPNDFPKETQVYNALLQGRSMWVKKTQLIEIECVVRGYLAGSGWKEYQTQGTVASVPLPKGLSLASKLPEPLFTPAIKAQEGHDENISFEQLVAIVGPELANSLKTLSLAIYNKAAVFLESKDLILADTKFEFGMLNGEIILIDEVLTPDSSRYWDKSTYKVGESPPSFDKQIIRDYLESVWNKEGVPPQLPAHIIEKTTQKYIELFERVTS